MDVSKKGNGKISIPGDLTVVNEVLAKSLKISDNAMFEGDVVVKGKLISLLEPEVKEEKKYENIFYLGEPDKNGTWRLISEQETGMLHIEKREEDEWVTKQSIL